MQLVRYLTSFFHVTQAGHSEAKYEVGKDYPVTEETRRHIAHGIAEVVETPDAEDSPAEVKAKAPKAKA